MKYLFDEITKNQEKLHFTHCPPKSTVFVNDSDYKKKRKNNSATLKPQTTSKMGNLEQKYESLMKLVKS